MAKNYMIYPCKTMRITQSYRGRTSHLPHCVGTPADYPFDEGCSDTGRDYIYCPCDEMKVVRIYGVGNSGTNTIWLTSTSKAVLANGKKAYVTMLITHSEDSDLKALKKGQTFRRKEKICREGKDGATAYHFHLSAATGKIKGNGWVRNSLGKWVLTTTGGTLPPEKVFFIDKGFTRVKDTAGLDFSYLPEKEKYLPGLYKVTGAELLRVRKKPSVLSARLKFSDLTDSAKSQIISLGGKQADGYVKGVLFTVTQVKDNWGKTPSGWVCLDYCEVMK